MEIRILFRYGVYTVVDLHERFRGFAPAYDFDKRLDQRRNTAQDAFTLCPKRKSQVEGWIHTE